MGTQSIVSTAFCSRRPHFKPAWSRQRSIDVSVVSKWGTVRPDCATQLPDLRGRVLWHSSDGLDGTVPGAKSARMAHWTVVRRRYVSLGVTWPGGLGAY